MAYKQQDGKRKKSIWHYIFFNPRTSENFDTWRLIFESRRLCRQIDRDMKRIMTPEQYRAYLAAGEPERKPGWLKRLFGGGR